MFWTLGRAWATTDALWRSTRPLSALWRTGTVSFRVRRVTWSLCLVLARQRRKVSGCGRTGYKGRIGIYEIFQITEDIGKLIFANEPTGVIRDAARRNGMRSLRDDAMRKAAAGISTLEEVIFVTLMDEN